MGTGGAILSLMDRPDNFIHPTAIIDGPNTHVGAETKVWHFVHVMSGAWIGNRCVIGQGCFIGKVRIGHGCKLQNNVSIYDGVTLNPVLGGGLVHGLQESVVQGTLSPR